MQVQLWHVIVVGTFLSYLMPGLLVIIVVPDRQSSGFIWTVSVYFVVASFLYLGTLFRIFYKRKNRFQQQLFPDESKDNPTFIDCPPSYAEVAETPPPYFLLPKSIQRSSSRLRREYQLHEQPQKHSKHTPNSSLITESSSNTFKRIIFRSKSLVTSPSTSSYSSFDLPSDAMVSLRLTNNYSEWKAEEGVLEGESSLCNTQSSSSIDESSHSNSRKSSSDSIYSLNQVGPKRKLSLGLRNTLSCPLSTSCIASQAT